MFKRILFSLFFLNVNALVFAQGVVMVVEHRDPNIGKEFYGLNVNVYDNFTGHSIKDVKAYLMTKDSVIIDSLQTTNGRFSFKVKRDMGLRSCILKMTHPTYQTLYSTHSLRQVGKQINFSLPDQFMRRKNVFKEKTLNEVVITATKIKMFYRGDTLIYNADAFNVADGSMLDALIKQLPGTELTREGEIFVNGRKVENLLLNGKDFFRGKNKLMLENLPYYMVKNIKVYEQMTEKAKVLHDETADKDYVMDVNLKKEYSKGYMANVEGGYGTEDSYLARLFGLRFTDVSRLAVVGGINNLNMSDYSFSGNTYDSGDREGRTDSKLLTAELMTDKKRNKNVLTMELRWKKSDRGTEVFQETFHSKGNTFSTTQNSLIDKDFGVSLSNKYTLKIPFWVESITDLRFNSKKDENDERYYESGDETKKQGLAMLDSLFGMGIAINDPAMINARKRWMNSRKKEYGVSQDFRFSHKLYSGDFVDVSAGADYAKRTNETDRLSQYLVWRQGMNQTDVAESIDHPNSHVRAKADASYRITRLFYDTDIRFYASYAFRRDKDNESIVDAVSMLLDALNSFNRRTTENKYSVGMDAKYNHLVQDKKLRTTIQLSLPLSFIDCHTDYYRYKLDTCLSQSATFFEPSLKFTHSKWRGDNAGNSLWKLEALTLLTYELPDAAQLITLPLTSDRINIYQGNALLKSPATWKSSLAWDWPMKNKMSYLRHTLTYTSYCNRIVNTYRYESGVYVNKPDNVNGTWNLEFNTRGQQFAKIAKLPITITFGMRSNYQRLKNFTIDGSSAKPMQIDNDELYNSANIMFRSYYKKVSGGIRFRVDWRKPMNANTNAGYSDTWDYKTDFWFSVNLPASIDWENNCTLIKRQGYASNELNRLSCEWDMTLSKSILKNRFGLKMQAIDILRQYKSVAYAVNERGVRETHTFSLPSYFLFSVSYKFNKQPAQRK